MRNRAVRIVCWLALAAAPAARSPAAEPEPTPAAAPAAPEPDVRTMTMAQLVAEFHGRVEMSRPASQRRIDLVNALRRLGPPLIEAIRTDLKDADAGVRTRALRLAQGLGHKARPLVPDVMAAVADDSPGVRAAAVPVLCQLRDPRAFGLLVRATRDPDSAVRLSVLRGGRAALADAPFALAVTALADADVHVRAAAVRELSEQRDKRAAAYLAPLLDDETVLHHDVREGVRTTHRVCDAAAAGLAHQVDGTYPLATNKTQDEYDALVRRWRVWWKENGRAFDDALYDEPELTRATR